LLAEGQRSALERAALRSRKDRAAILVFCSFRRKACRGAFAPFAEAPTTPDPATGDVIVKEGIHPQYEEVTVHCGCGATWKTRSTKKDMHLDICSNCHPFFTGRQKLLDIEGRVERFTKKFGTQTAEQRKTAAKAAKATKAKTATKAKAAKRPV
jgi:large subunit ribosomal protein L31